MAMQYYCFFSKQPRVLRLLRGTRIVQVFETCVPCQCFGCRTCDTWYTRYAFDCRRTGKVFFENTTVVIFFFVLWRVDRETFCCMLHFLVADSGCCNCFQGVNPRISHSVGELLFLSNRAAVSLSIVSCFCTISNAIQS